MLGRKRILDSIVKNGKSILAIRYMGTSSAAEKRMLDRMLRVDHAGEFGATRIYAGQYAALKGTSEAALIKHMWDQEKVHLETFQKLIPEYRSRPTVLMPIWNVAGFLLGAGTAMMGKEAAMACTVAVETVIGEHYDDQIRKLMETDPKKYEGLMKTLSKFRDEEMEHHDTGLEHDAEKAPMYKVLNTSIKAGCKIAIWLSERI
ncbi:unnamed protein product [Dimorphilus gyrociliatus]|uniref:5-demethoxyubiquinone hydroxylase, mitochondrial n=1 Tax=Dimorphilus gyrociliatus TaxID=2664684 RepID=A0A7I8W6M7_9ANNE|nr:unnamed protein product [Dimorphilus gyrociliatus]